MFVIEIIDRESEEVVQKMTAHSQNEAERIKRGASINLNHTDYKVVIREDN